MAAITWRELTGAPDTGAFRAMSGATETVNTGFGALNKVLERHEAGIKTQYDRTQDAQSVAFREALAGATTPEQVAQIQAQRDTLLAGLDPTRRAALVGAEDARLAFVRTNITAGQQFQDAQTLWNNRALVNRAQALFAVGKGAEATALLEPIKDLLPTYGKAIADGTALIDARTKLESELDTAKTNRNNQTTTAEAAKKNAETLAGQLLVAQKDADTRAGQLKVNKDESGLRMQEALEKRLSDLNSKLSTMGGGLTSPSAQKEIDDFIKTLPKEDQSRMQEAIGRLANNPKFADLTPEAAIMAARADLSTKGPILKWFWNGSGDGIESEAEKIRNSPEYAASLVSRGDAIKSLTQQRDVLRETLYPGTTTPKPAPVPDPTPKPAPPAAPAPAPTIIDAKLAQLAEVEQRMLSAGQLEELSPEVKKFLDEQSARDRAAVVSAARSAWGGAEKLAAAGADLFTLPVRAGMGVVNNGIRAVNVMGANVPFIPDSEGIISSLTPYSDMLARRDMPPQAAKDAQALRAELLKEINGTKKAK